ncbi:MAG: BatD family protein [Halioglobus sp.]|nr:BatD family protein [Halioglobus sp.]
MRSSGRHWCVAGVAALLLCCTPAIAAVTAIVDRDDVALGDTLRLVLTATDGEALGDVDLGALEADFEILQRTTTSQTNIVNGSRSSTRQLQIELAPRVEGNLQIPALRVDGVLTDPLPIRVTPAPDIDTGGQPLVFEAEVDRQQVYVQGQLILTLRIMQAVNLEGRNISEVEIDGAFVHALQQESFQRSIDGRPWLVHELRFAIFPEQSGTLEIPAQVFSGREVTGRRSFFDLGGGGRRLRRSTAPLTVDVLPRPAGFPSPTWLPARQVSIQESWSTPPEQLRVGESATRTITLTAAGLQGAQLPPLPEPQVDGIKFYPDQPRISETEIENGLRGTRVDSTAVVPTRAGNLTLPEVRIPWWDTESETVRYAVLPQRTLQVAAAPLDSSTAAPPLAVEVDAASVAAPGLERTSALPWQIVSALSSLGWLLTLAYLVWLQRGGKSGRATAASAEQVGERRRFKALLAACRANDAAATRQALIAWAQARSADAALVSLQAVAAWAGDSELRAELETLDNTLYGDGQPGWDGSALGRKLEQLRDRKRGADGAGPDTLTLYPGQQARAG